MYEINDKKQNIKKMKKNIHKVLVIKEKVVSLHTEKVRKNNFVNEIVKGPDKLNVRGFYIVSN